MEYSDYISYHMLYDILRGFFYGYCNCFQTALYIIYLNIQVWLLIDLMLANMFLMWIVLNTTMQS